MLFNFENKGHIANLNVFISVIHGKFCHFAVYSHCVV